MDPKNSIVKGQYCTLLPITVFSVFPNTLRSIHPPVYEMESSDSLSEFLARLRALNGDLGDEKFLYFLSFSSGDFGVDILLLVFFVVDVGSSKVSFS